MSVLVASILTLGRLGLMAFLIFVIAFAGLESFLIFNRYSSNPVVSFFKAALLVGPILLGLAWHISPEVFSLGIFDGQVLALLLIAVKSQDIFAYFVGSTMGRHALMPSVSPKKTWEGAIAGVMASALVTWMFAQWWQAFTPLPAFFYGLILGVASLAGDLFESKIKRRARMKDSGNFLPGFGGMLDLVDSFIFAAPLSWLCWQLA